MKAAPKSAWKPGQSGNPRGRPPRVVEQEYLSALMTSCTLTDWKRIVRRAVAGDGKAREWLARYLAPVPDRLEVSGVGGAPIERNVNLKGEIEHLTDEELEARLPGQARGPRPHVLSLRAFARCGWNVPRGWIRRAPNQSWPPSCTRCTPATRCCLSGTGA